MISFFIAAALLIVTALLFVLYPLMGRQRIPDGVSHAESSLSIYRDQIVELDRELASQAIDRLQYDLARREIDRRVLEEVEEESDQEKSTIGQHWVLAIAISVLMPLAAVGLYLTLGEPAAIDVVAKNGAAAGGGHASSKEQIADLAEQLRGRLKANPNDTEGWLMLAKTEGALGRFDESVLAYRELLKRVKEDSQTLADFADTLAVAQGRSLIGEPEQLIQRALVLDGNNVKALALAGTLSFQQGKYADAAAHWKKILLTVPAESPLAEQIRGAVADAEMKSGTSGISDAGPSRQAPVAKVVQGRISGRLDISTQARQASGPDDTVFVFARAADGPKMPLAILKSKVGALPLDFELNDSMAMAPDMSITKFKQLVVGARLSKSGNATPAVGDWESELVPSAAGATGIKLTISRQR